MELKNFVSETLKQVLEGVKTAQSFAKEHGGQINPKGITVSAASTHSQMYTPRGELVQLMEFDVAVTTTEEDKAKGGIGIFVGAFGVGVQGESGNQNSAINRIQFRVPIILPNQD
jgi:hypothetical protein